MAPYLNDPMEQDGLDDAPFAGGSTEQKDQYLADRDHQRTEFRAALAVAQANLNANATRAIEDERAWLEQEATRHRFTSRDDVHAVLYGERKQWLGRRPNANEADRIQRFAHRYWDAMMARDVA